MAVLIPLGLLIALGMVQSYRDWQGARDLQELEPLMRVTNDAVSMLRAIQDERGETILQKYEPSGAGGRPDLADLRAATDRAFKTFRTALAASTATSAHEPKLHLAIVSLDEATILISRIRAGVDAGRTDWERTLGFYNDVAVALSDVATVLVQHAENAGLLRHMLPALMLLNAGEEASKTAATGALVINLARAGQPFGKPFVWFYQSNAEHTALTASYFRLATSAQNAEFMQSPEAIGPERFDRLRDRLLTLPGSRDVSGLAADTWYAAATDRTVTINGQVDRLVASAAASIADQISNAQTTFASLVVVFIAFLSVASAVSVGVAFPVSNQIRGLRRALLDMANGDFDRPVPHMDRVDEIGETARALDLLRANAAKQALVQETLDATHRSMSEGILVLDAGGIVTDANVGAGILFGCATETLIGQHVSIVLPDDPLAALGPGLAVESEPDLLSKDRDARAKRMDGWFTPVRISVAHMDVRGRPYFTVVVSDMSERARIAADLKKATELAQSADIAKGTFLANMSHEIRTPLHGIIGMARLLAASGLTQEQHDQLSKILTSTDLLLGIVSDILDFTKIDSGELVLETADFSLGETISSVVALFELQARQKGITLRSSIADGVPEGLRGDPLRISQILMNLLSNAVKFTEHGGVDLSVAVVSDSGDRLTLALTVDDTGIGLDEEQLSVLFEPFTQADATTTRRFGGSGLGLAIARGLAQKMDGDVSGTSSVGRGSTFRAEVSVGRAEGPVGRQRAEEEEEICNGLKPMRILVAEDNEVNQLVARGLLENLGMTVDVVDNGKDVLKRLDRDAAASYDMLLLDIQMPVMDGFETASALRGDPRFDHLPVISMTAHALLEERDKCLAVGMQDHISKPFQRKELCTLLERWSPANRPRIVAGAEDKHQEREI